VKGITFLIILYQLAERRVLFFENIQKGTSWEIIYLIRGYETLWNLSL